MKNNNKNIEEYNPNKKGKLLIVFDDMIADILSNKNSNSVVTELFIRDRKLNNSLDFITQPYFKAPKHCAFFIVKIQNNREIQHIACNHSSDIDLKDFMSLYKKCTAKSYSILVIDATFASDNLLRFRKYL